MNEPHITPTEKDLECTFGCVYLVFWTLLWTLRISYPDGGDLFGLHRYIELLSLAVALPGIFRRIWFRSWFLRYYCAANAMVFGSVVPASTWETSDVELPLWLRLYMMSQGLFTNMFPS